MRKCLATGEPEMTDAEISLLIDELKSTGNNDGILEIGTAAGGTLVRILKGLPEKGRPRVVVIDTFDYFADQLDVFKRNLSDNGFDPEAIDARVTRSNLAFKDSLNAREAFSFIIVDGSHKLKHVTQDLSWLRLLSVGGKAAFHDYSEHLPGVRIAVDAFIRRNANYRVKARAGSLVILEKTAATKRVEVTRLGLFFASAYSIVLQNKKTLDKLGGLFRKKS